MAFKKINFLKFPKEIHRLFLLLLPGFFFLGELAAQNNSLLPGNPTGNLSLSQGPSPAFDNDSSSTPLIQLKVTSFFSKSLIHMGDSLEYTVRVSWEDPHIPVTVLAPDSLDFIGLKRVGQSTTHRKIASAAGLSSQTEFTFQLVAASPGSATASALRLRYFAGVRGSEEQLYVAPVHIQIDAAKVPLQKRLWFRLIALVALLAFLYWIALMGFKQLQKKKNEKIKPQNNWAERVREIKGRIRLGESKKILLDIEALCIQFLQSQAKMLRSENRFNPLLDEYLGEHTDISSDIKEEWYSLKQEFEHARFGGGQRESHELFESLRKVSHCLGLKADGEEDE